MESRICRFYCKYIFGVSDLFLGVNKNILAVPMAEMVKTPATYNLFVP